MAYSLQSEARILLLSVSRLSVSIIEFSGENSKSGQIKMVSQFTGLKRFGCSKDENKNSSTVLVTFLQKSF